MNGALMIGIGKATFLTVLGLTLCGPLWSQTAFEVTQLPFPRSLHGAVVVENTLYAIGGNSPAGYTTSVQSAKISSDRTLGIWTENRPLPQRLTYLGSSVFSVGRTIYVCGGKEMQPSGVPGEYTEDSNNSIYYSKADKDGNLGPWQRSERWANSNTTGMAAVTDGRFVYTIGGRNDLGIVVPNVYVSEISRTDGQPGPWRETNPLPAALWYHSAYHHNGTIYTAGGRSGAEDGSVVPYIYESKIQSDGQLTPWKTSSIWLNRPVNGAAACASLEYLILVGGRTAGGNPVPAVQFSALTATGISPWESVDTSITGLQQSAAAAHWDYAAAYVVGGLEAGPQSAPTSAVYCLPLAGSAQASSPIPEEFQDFEAGLSAAASNRKNVLILFYSDNVPAARAIHDGLTRNPSFFQRVGTDAVAVAVNAEQRRDLATKYKVLRLPTLILTDADGTALREVSGTMSPNQIVDFVKGQ